jgi:hypothetical protein
MHVRPTATPQLMDLQFPSSAAGPEKNLLNNAEQPQTSSKEFSDGELVLPSTGEPPEELSLDLTLPPELFGDLFPQLANVATLPTQPSPSHLQ